MASSWARVGIIVLDTSSIFAGHTQILFGCLVFSGNEPLVTDVFVGGSPVITEGRHETKRRHFVIIAVNRLLA